MDGIKRGWKFLLCLVTGMVTGALLGIVVVNALISYKIDGYHERISYLESAVEERDTRLKKLEESINNKKLILKDIDVILLHHGDEIEKIALEKEIKEKYSKFLGKEVNNIDGDMVTDIIDRRIMVIENKIYKLMFRKLILTEVLKIWIEVEEEDL